MFIGRFRDVRFNQEPVESNSRAMLERFQIAIVLVTLTHIISNVLNIVNRAKDNYCFGFNLYKVIIMLYIPGHFLIIYNNKAPVGDQSWRLAPVRNPSSGPTRDKIHYMSFSLWTRLKH